MGQNGRTIQKLYIGINKPLWYIYLKFHHAKINCEKILSQKYFPQNKL